MSKISVIVPVYNVEKYLNRCVDSILAQTFTDFELILVDDGSPDNSGKICDEFAGKDNRIHVIHKENGGLSDARNAGIDWAFENSDSEWITFIDSDDWVHPRYLEILFSAVVINNVKISACKYLVTSGENLTLAVHNDAKVLSAERYYCSNSSAINSTTKLFKKELLGTIRFPKGRINEDVYVTYKLLFATDKIAFIDEALYAYFQSSNSITRSAWTEKNLDSLHGYADMIAFFENAKYMEAYKKTIVTYGYSICAQIENCKKFGVEEKRAISILKSFLKSHLKKYKHTGVLTIKKHPGLYEIAYPNKMKLYWRITWLLHLPNRILIKMFGIKLYEKLKKKT